jgi:hypothetical protein
MFNVLFRIGIIFLKGAECVFIDAEPESWNSWDEKFALDVWYVEHNNLRLDIRILWTTVWKILKREGISAAGEATMPRFMGSGWEDRDTDVRK